MSQKPIQFLKGQSTDLSQEAIQEGNFLFTEDTNELYIDYENSTGTKNRKPIKDKETADKVAQLEERVPTKTTEANKVWKTDASGNPGWYEDENTTYSNFVKSGSGAKAGLVPAPSTTADTTKYLREDGTWQVPSNTKNTAGALNTSSKIYLIGATSQSDNPQTYTHDTAYVGTDGCLYSNNKKVITNYVDELSINNTIYTKRGNFNQCIETPNILIADYNWTPIEEKTFLDVSNASHYIYPTWETGNFTINSTTYKNKAFFDSFVFNESWVNMPSTATYYQCYLTDGKEGILYYDSDGSLTIYALDSALQISQIKAFAIAGYNENNTYYLPSKIKKIENDIINLQNNASSSDEYQPYYAGTCSTAASTAAKTVSITGFELKIGAIIRVTFSNVNTSSSATLNVNSTGAKAMYYMNGNRMYYIPSGIYLTFIYDGTYWRYLDAENAIIGPRQYERYGIKMTNSALVPINSSYRPNLGSSTNKFPYVYTDYVYTSSINASNTITGSALYSTIASNTVEVLPVFPIMSGHFLITSYHSLTLDANVMSKYAKSYYTGSYSNNCGVSSSGCASACSFYNSYDIVITLRIKGYDYNNGTIKPFVEEFILSTAQNYSNCSGANCANYSTAAKAITTPQNYSFYVAMHGPSAGASTTDIATTFTITSMNGGSNIHFTEIALVP